MESRSNTLLSEAAGKMLHRGNWLISVLLLFLCNSLVSASKEVWRCQAKFICLCDCKYIQLSGIWHWDLKTSSLRMVVTKWICCKRIMGLPTDFKSFTSALFNKDKGMHNKKYCRVKLCAGWIYSLYCSIINSPNAWIVLIESGQRCFPPPQNKGQARSMQYHVWYLQMFKMVKSRFCTNPRSSIAIWLHYLSELPCTDKACDLWLQLLKVNCVQTNTPQTSLGSSGWCWWSSVWRVDKICQSLISPLYIWKKHGEECLHGYGEHLIFPGASQQE